MLIRVVPINDPVIITAPLNILLSDTASGTVIGTHITVFDVDLSGALSVVLELKDGMGTMTLSSTVGLHVLVSNSTYVYVRGLPIHLNRALSSLTYVPDITKFTSQKKQGLLTIVASDDDNNSLGASGAAGSGAGTGNNATTTTKTVSLSLMAGMSNVPPSILLPYEIVMEESTTHPFTLAITDVDAVATHAIRVVVSCLHGKMIINTPAGADPLPENLQVESVGPTLAALSMLSDLTTFNGLIHRIHYVPNLHYHGEDQISFFVDDRGSGKSQLNKNHNNARNITQEVLVVILPVNDPPTIAMNVSSLTMVEGGTVTLSSVTVGDIDLTPNVYDTNSGSSVELNVTVSGKDIAVGSVLVVPTTTIGGVWFKLQNATFISMRGSLESINEALAFISYRPKNTFSGTSLLVSIQSEESVHRVTEAL